MAYKRPRMVKNLQVMDHALVFARALDVIDDQEEQGRFAGYELEASLLAERFFEGHAFGAGRWAAAEAFVLELHRPVVVPVRPVLSTAGRPRLAIPVKVLTIWAIVRLRLSSCRR